MEGINPNSPILVLYTPTPHPSSTAAADSPSSPPVATPPSPPLPRHASSMVSPPRGRVFSCSRQVATPPPLVIAPPPSNNPQRGQGQGSISTRPPLRGVFQSSPISSHLVPLLFLGVLKCDDNQTTISLATPNPPHTHDSSRRNTTHSRHMPPSS